jgi:hypothetical protein
MTEEGCQIVTAVGKAFIEICTERIKHLRNVNIIKSDFMTIFCSLSNITDMVRLDT